MSEDKKKYDVVLYFCLPQTSVHFLSRSIGKHVLKEKPYIGEQLPLPHEQASNGPRLHRQSSKVYAIREHNTLSSPQVIVRITLPDDSPESINYTSRVMEWYDWRRRLEEDQLKGQNMLNLEWK